MSEETFGAVMVKRQTMALPGTSCDLRMGHGALNTMGKELRSLTGKPRLAAALIGEDVPDEVAQEVRRQLADGGFEAVVLNPPADKSCTLGSAEELVEQLDGAGVTADDIMLAVGDDKILGLASFVSGIWCGGTPLAVVPTDAYALLEGIASPRALDVLGGRDRMVSIKAYPRMAFFDLDLPGLTEGTAFEAALAMCVATAVCDGNDTFASLAGDAESISGGNVDVFATHLLDLVRSRSKLASATSIAMRQALSYGMVFARALNELVEGCPEAVLIAEDLRFSSRLAVGCGKADIDLVYAQDALLERFGLGEVACDVSAQELTDAVRAACFAHSNRFMFPLPESIGRVRLSSVEDDAFAANIAAWCDSRIDLLADLDAADEAEADASDAAADAADEADAAATSETASEE